MIVLQYHQLLWHQTVQYYLFLKIKNGIGRRSLVCKFDSATLNRIFPTKKFKRNMQYFQTVYLILHQQKNCNMCQIKCIYFGSASYFVYLWNVFPVYRFDSTDFPLTQVCTAYLILIPLSYSYECLHTIPPPQCKFLTIYCAAIRLLLARWRLESLQSRWLWN